MQGVGSRRSDSTSGLCCKEQETNGLVQCQDGAERKVEVKGQTAVTGCYCQGCRTLLDAAIVSGGYSGTGPSGRPVALPQGWVVRMTRLHSAICSGWSQGRSPARVVNGIWHKHYGGRTSKGCGFPVSGITSAVCTCGLRMLNCQLTVTVSLAQTHLAHRTSRPWDSPDSR